MKFVIETGRLSPDRLQPSGGLYFASVFICIYYTKLKGCEPFERPDLTLSLSFCSPNYVSVK